MDLDSSGMLSYHKMAFGYVERLVELKACAMQYLRLNAHPKSSDIIGYCHFHFNRIGL